MRRSKAEQQEIFDDIVRNSLMFRYNLHNSKKVILVHTPEGNFVVYNYNPYGQESQIRISRMANKRPSGLSHSHAIHRAISTKASQPPKYIRDAIMLFIHPEEP